MMKQSIGLLVLACPVASLAQTAAVEQVRGLTQTFGRDDVGELKMITEDRGEVVELNGQPARALRFRTGVSTAVEYQSNAPLLGSGPHNDWVSISAVEAGLNKPLGKRFSFDLSIRADVSRYFHIPNISYWGPSATALFDYRPRTNWPRVYAGGQLYHYDFIDRPGKITEAGAVLAGMDQSWIFQGGRNALSAGYQFSRYWASPETEDRASNALFATFTHQLTASLYAQASYIWQYTHFDAQARNDSRHVAGLALIYAPKDKFALRLYANYVRNESSNPLTDYENFATGLGAAFVLQF